MHRSLRGSSYVKITRTYLQTYNQRRIAATIQMARWLSAGIIRHWAPERAIQRKPLKTSRNEWSRWVCFSCHAMSVPHSGTKECNRL
jgi:hypothetical protein